MNNNLSRKGGSKTPTQGFSVLSDIRTRPQDESKKET